MTRPTPVAPGLVTGSDPLAYRLPDPHARHAAALDRWRRHGLGIFIHWGVNCRTTHELSYSRGREQTARDYDAQARTLDPRHCDVAAWARLFRESGAGYVNLVARHADGFCWWPTDTDDHHVGRTPFGRDLVAELAHACREEGLAFGVYLSIADWRHPLYGVGIDPDGHPKRRADPDAWLDHLTAQAAELLTRYGPLHTLWFDAEWDWCWSHAHGLALYDACRGLQDDLLINDRVDRSRQGLKGLPLGPVPPSIPRDWLDPLLYTYFRTPRPDTPYAGDYQTPEQELPAAEGVGPVTPWETCLTMNRQWSWTPHGEQKPLAELTRTLDACNAGDGNLLLNVSPDPDGMIPAWQAARLRGLGEHLGRTLSVAE